MAENVNKWKYLKTEQKYGNTAFIVLQVYLEIINFVKTSMTDRDYGTPWLINRTIV